MSRAWELTSRANAAEKDYDRAIQDFYHYVVLAPDDADGYFERGSAYGSRGDYDRAIQDFDQCVLLAPDYAQALFERGFAYEAKGDYEAAVGVPDRITLERGSTPF